MGSLPGRFGANSDEPIPRHRPRLHPTPTCWPPGLCADPYVRDNELDVLWIGETG
ncbi:MAG: hypothetical protein R2838_10475 [Caldilineaceae bacterium]